MQKKRGHKWFPPPPPLPLLPHRGSAVQRGRLVKSVSLVPSQDEVLPALSPSAPIRTAVLVHTQRGRSTPANTTPSTHTHTRALPALMTVAWTITATMLTFAPRLMGQMTVGSRSSPWGWRCSSGCDVQRKEREKGEERQGTEENK